MDRKVFFDKVKPLFGSFSPDQVGGIDTILDEAEKRKTPVNWLAYMFATAFHETDKTMQPIAEYGKGKNHPYGKPAKYKQAPYGRGMVQLTWDYNYEKADKELKLNGALLKNFDLAMDTKIATEIMFTGMEQGWFTGKKLGNYCGEKPDYVNARRIINGTDKAKMIAEYAKTFEGALRLSGYGLPSATAPAIIPVNAPLGAPVNSKFSLFNAILNIITTIIGGRK